MDIDDMVTAVGEAKRTIRSADHQVAVMADLIRGRLRKGGVGRSVLRELRKYNPHTGVWSD